MQTPPALPLRLLLSIRPVARAVPLALLFALSASSVAAQVGGTTQKLLAASRDADTPQANSTVRVGGCSGTLIAPQVVISAGHCGFYDGRLGFTPNHWYPTRANGINVTAEFGADASGFQDRIPVTHMNISGNRDVILLGLERAPDPSVAMPRPPLVDPPREARANPGRFWGRQSFTAAGWGGTDPGSHSGSLPTIRQTASANDARLECYSAWEGSICVRSGRSGTSQTRGGDSGGPLYWTNPENRRSYLVGVLQGYGPEGDRYFQSWSEAPLAWHPDRGTPPGAPIGLTQRDWIRQAIDRSFCAVLRRDAAQTARMRPLHLWWSGSRGDNFTTANPEWAGCEGDQVGGYTYVGIQGMVFSPDHPQPAGTLPLFRWWSPTRADNFLTSDPRWAGRDGARKSPDYEFKGVEGYVYDPASAAGEAVALWSWWSPGREDNFLTTDTRWAPGSAGSPDYRYVRLEGYVNRASDPR